MPKKDKAELQVGYFRSKNLSICSLFNIDRHEAAVLFAHLETVDKLYTEKVNIEAFAKRFLPNGKFVFQYLWSYFVVIFKHSRLGLGTASYTENISRANSELEIEDPDHGTYVEVIAFLFMIMSVEKNQFAFLVYWLVYVTKGEKKTRKGLIHIVNKLWTLDKTNTNKKDHQKRKMFLSLVKGVAKHLETGALDMKAFQVVDFRIQSAISIPLKNLQDEIKRKIVNQAFWKKSIREIKAILDDPSIVVPRMGEKRSVNIMGKPSLRYGGDRKYAWFDLRDYIENFFRFHEAVNSIVIEPVTLFQKLKKFVFKPALKESKIVPVDLEKPNDNPVGDYSLKEKVDSRKMWDVEKYYDEAEYNRGEAMKMLDKCQEELDEPLPDLFDFETGNERKEDEDSDDDEIDDDDSSLKN